MIPQALIQRLIILHDGLISCSNNSSSCPDYDRSSRRWRGDPGAALSEDASLEEHAEFVLYYHDHSLPVSTTLESSISRHATEEAVRFAGLCRALRSLPRALIQCDLDDNDDDDNNNDDVKNSSEERYAEEDVVDEAEVVHFSESRLIYVPLELDGNVFAVAQIPRRGADSGGGCADPISIKNVILRIHTEFALMNGGGGIHRSLLRTRRLECTNEWTMGDVVRPPRKMSTSYVTNNNDWRYGGMAELFELRRERRKITRDTSSKSPTSLIDCDHRISMLCRVLPITTFRAELVVHYDDRLRHIVGRRVVDDVPCLNPCPRSMPNEFISLTAAEFLKAMVRERVPKVMSNRGGRLYGMSFFYQDGLVHSEFAAAAGDYDRRQGESDADIIQHNAAIAMINNTLPSKLRMIERNFDKKVDAGFVTYTSSQADTNDGPIDYIYIRSMEKYILLQRIYLPIFDVIDLDNEIKTFVAMFESQDLTFLLFFELPGGEQGEEMRQSNDGRVKSMSSTTQALIDALVFLNDELTQFCCIVSKADSSASTSSIKEDDETTFRGEHGMEIIHINRDENSFVIYSQHDLVQNVGLKRAVSKPKFGLRGKGIKSKDINVASSYPSNLLDCRHKLAASLPPEVMLALDEMFNGIGCFTGRSSDSGGIDVKVEVDSGSPPKSIELCTFLPQGWVYGRACGSIELYIVLDPSKFMTVNEVQKKTTRIREILGVE